MAMSEARTTSWWESEDSGCCVCLRITKVAGIVDKGSFIQMLVGYLAALYVSNSITQGEFLRLKALCPDHEADVSARIIKRDREKGN